MPYIQTRTNTEIPKEKEISIKEKIGKAITLLGKTENWLMVEFVPSCDMFFKGDNTTSIAYVDIKLYGRCESSAYNNMTKEITTILNEELNISPDNIYISYSEFTNWGWNGNNF